MRISRSVSRYAVMVQLSVAVLAGLGVARLWPRRNPGATFVHSSAILAVILFESWVAPFPMSPPDTPAFYHEIAAMGERRAILNLPMNYDRPGYLLYQTVHQQPLSVAYISRDDPRTLTERVPVLQHFRHLAPDILRGDPVRIAPTVLHDLGIGLVIQDHYKMPGGLERSYTETLANAIFAGAPPLYADERLTVHEVQPPRTPQPYLMLGAYNWGPLTVAADGTRWRVPTPAGAAVQLLHPAPALQLQLRYRTLPNVALKLFDADGVTLLATLPPTPAGQTVTLALDELSPGAVLAEILLVPGAPEGVWVEALELRSAVGD
jgi:hypothetical protein